MLKPLAPNRRFPIRYMTECGCRVCVTSHAVKRALKRRIDLVERLHKLRGKKISEYRKYGVVARYDKRSHEDRFIVVITVY